MKDDLDFEFPEIVTEEEASLDSGSFSLDDMEDSPPKTTKATKATKNSKKQDKNTPPPSNQIKCTGKVNQIRYWKDNWGILAIEVIELEYGAVDVHPIYGTIIVKGNMPRPSLTETYTVIGNEIIDPQWGKQFDLVYIGMPDTLDSPDRQKIFLSKILTDTQLKSLYEALSDPFETIKNEDVQTLVNIKGIGVVTANKIIERYQSSIDYSEIYIELDGYGLTPRMIKRLIDKYKSPQLVIDKIKTNPYILADEVDGIGFKKADEMALKAGMASNSPFRITSFIQYVLNKSAEKGNSWVNPSDLVQLIKDELDSDITNKELKPVFQNMYDKNILWCSGDKTKIALMKLYMLEKQIATDLLRILACENSFTYVNWESTIKDTEKFQGWDFTAQQTIGIKTVLKNQVTIITGWGGTGKSSIVKGMLDVLYHYAFAQCALSGKAAARLAEVTGKNNESYTIHRLLGWTPKGFDYNAGHQMWQDIIIVDEVSMIGGYLFYDLIQAVKNGAKLVMLCDVGQLESIGTLNIAKDLIESGVIPVVRLTEIHRQAKKSAIVTESLKVWHGEQITSAMIMEENEIRGELQDLELLLFDDKDNTAYSLIKQFKKHIVNAKSIFDVQIIVPMRTRGSSCTFKLNEQAQTIYNPPVRSKQEVLINISKEQKYTLREGDKVINVGNNYKTFDINGKTTPIFNGNIGIIHQIDEFNDIILIDFQYLGRVVVPRTHWRNIELAYAMTCHKAQGSEFHTVIIGLDYSAYAMLNKEWVYTAITRAKKYCVFCAQNAALRQAIEQSNVQTKQTFLLELLQTMFDEIENY